MLKEKVDDENDIDQMVFSESEDSDCMQDNSPILEIEMIDGH